MSDCPISSVLAFTLQNTERNYEDLSWIQKGLCGARYAGTAQPKFAVSIRSTLSPTALAYTLSN